MAKRKDEITINESLIDDNIDSTLKTEVIELDEINIGRKTLDTKSHSHIAQITDTEEIEQRKTNFERQEKRAKLGLEKEEDILDNQIISQELVEQLSRSNKATRFDVSPNEGLSDEQVEQRVHEGLVNDTQKQYSKTYKQIFFNNICTFFNILCIFVAAALIYVKEYKNLTFMLILTINTFIGIYQEIKAKKTIDKLSIVTAPTSTVIRNSVSCDIPVKELVLDDIVTLKNGKQISADCKVVTGEIEVNEALLTGESDTVKKVPGSSLYAGSFVTSGTCTAKVDRVGQDCYIQKLQAKAKRYSKPKSELLKSLKWITTFITIVLIPLGSIIAYINYSSSSAVVYSPTFGTSGTLMVYGVTSNNTDWEIGKLTDIKEEADSFVTVSSTEINIPEINRIKISYDNKASGNISISDIKIYSAIIDSNGDYQMGELINDMAFNESNASSQLDSLFSQSSADKYLDGTIKLENTGSYIMTKAFSQTSKVYIRVTLQSRGYGYDNTPEEMEKVKKEIVRLTVNKTAGSLVGMIPAGLFLLVTIALSVSVVKLSKSKTLVQELYCIEMLARVDCICLDKTGTITDGTMKVRDIIDLTTELPKGQSIDLIMGAFIGALEDNNLTSIALQEKFGVNFEYKKISTVPFSSARKMSAVTFEDKGTFILGAPEFVYQGKSKKVGTLVEKKAAMGYRVLMLAKSDKPIIGGKIPMATEYLALIVLEDHIREEAYDTITWFKENGVQVKVISGDNPATVAEIAAKAGVEGASDYISLEGLSPQEVETIATDYTIYGRVSPDQKAILIKTLKQKGKTVAMTGDGVNDILAMKESDCSVAMASGSEAARNVAHLVLLDSNFANMPKVVLEGRRVINNIQSSASLYLMKTLFVMAITFLSIICKNIFKTGYPFEPIQFMLLEFFVIGAPSTFLAIQPNKNLIKGSFIRNIFLNCITQAICLILSVTVIYMIARKNIPGLDLTNYAEVNSIAVIVLTMVGWVILFNICRPFNILRGSIAAISFIMIILCLTIPELASLLGISYQFKDLDITKQLFTLLMIFIMVPLETVFSSLIERLNQKPKEVSKVQ